MTLPQEVMLCPETVTLRGAQSLDINASRAAFGLMRRGCRCEAVVPRGCRRCVTRHARRICACSGVAAFAFDGSDTGSAGGGGVLSAKEAALVRILGSLSFNQVCMP